MGVTLTDFSGADLQILLLQYTEIVLRVSLLVCYCF